MISGIDAGTPIYEEEQVDQECSQFICSSDLSKESRSCCRTDHRDRSDPQVHVAEQCIQHGQNRIRGRDHTGQEISNDRGNCHDHECNCNCQGNIL